jgi:hydroxyacylglutathione hydrolase
VPESQRLLVDVVISDLFVQNSFVARREGRVDCLIVDPGFDADRIIAFLDDRNLTPAAILNTHGHADHIAGNGVLKERWPECPLLIGRGDAAKLTDARQNLSGAFGFAVTSPAADRLVGDGDRLELAGLDLEVLETPGHSAGHVVYLCKTGSPWQLFGGDMLFDGSVGRSDFPDSNPQRLVESIRSKLYTLPEDTIVRPGHGEATTIGREKRSNPFVRA